MRYWALCEREDACALQKLRKICIRFRIGFARSASGLSWQPGRLRYNFAKPNERGRYW